MREAGREGSTKRTLRGVATLVVALASAPACEGLIGAEFDRSTNTGDACVDCGGGANGADGGGGLDAAPDVDANVSWSTPQCGAKGGLAASPWPTGAACNTRISLSDQPSLKAPRILWRYLLGAGTTKAFLTAPAIGSDGTLYAVAYDPPPPPAPVSVNDMYRLVAVRPNGSERFRVLIPGIAPTRAAPTVAADGTVYVSAGGKLHAYDGASGASKWAVDIGLNAEPSSPTVLDDGTIVVVGAPDLHAFHPDKTVAWKVAPTAGRSFGFSAAVLPSGILAVAELAAVGAFEGGLQFVTPQGAKGVRVPLPYEPVTTPLVTPSVRLVVRTKASTQVIDAFGTIEVQQIGLSLADPHPFAILSEPHVFFTAERDAPIQLDLGTGAVTRPNDGPGTSAFAGNADGTLVWGERDNGKLHFRLRRPDDSDTAIALDPSPESPTGPAIGNGGVVYLPWGETLYAIGD